MNALSTPVGKKAKAIENSLVKEFKRIYRNSIEPYLGFLTIEEIKRGLETEINNLIRSKVEQAYKLGSVAVANFIKEPNIFTSNDDHMNIGLLASALADEFWATIEHLGVRATQHEVVDERIEPLTPFNVFAALLGIGSWIAFSSVNDGIRSKTLQLKDSITNLSEAEAVRRFGNLAHFTIKDRLVSTSERGFPIKFVYLTANDGKVDPQFCGPLNRKEFEIDDKSAPQPPLHRHCRCVIVPKNLLTNEFLI